MANLAAANVMHRKTRTAVSVLAVAGEGAMVMLLVGMANGTLGDIAERLQNVGADVLFQPPHASLILGATSAVMPMPYVDLIKQGAGGRLYARIEDVQDAIGTPDKASFFLIKGRSASDADKLAKALQEKFKGHKITPIAQVSKVMQDNAVGLQQFKQALTGMAVVISFLVVLLAMYTTIIERTREIGILRAIGASQGKVVQLVIVESFLIFLAGGGVGIILAIPGRW